AWCHSPSFNGPASHGMMIFVGLHVGTEDSINPCLVTWLQSEPFEHLRIKPHGHNCFAARQYNLGILPKFFVRRVCIRIGFDLCAHFGITRTQHPIPIRTVSSSLRFFSSSSVFHEALLST